MNWQVISLADVPATAWRNGGGITRELVAWPQASDWLWRLSVAEVAASGPFSRFDGIERWFAVLQGAGVQLTVTSTATTTTQIFRISANDAPLRFDGGAATDCQLLSGPTQDFNLMLRRGRAQAQMRRVHGRFTTPVVAPKIVAVYAIQTGARVIFNHVVLQLPSNTLAWRMVEQDASVGIDTENALWIEIPL